MGNITNEELLLKNTLESQGIVASSPALIALYKQGLFLANFESTILIQGESGVGKDRLAKFIHANGPRKEEPFIQINCSAIPQALFESELFGYDSGTFSGALNSGKKGLLEAAQGGTLYLDEIGELNLANQVKLLDFLQTKQILRLGSGERRNVDVRIISATNRDLKHSIDIGLFREDLYYRICVISLDIPPLRERPEDILALSAYFISHNKLSEEEKFLSLDGMKYLQRCFWPGNVRELQNVLERICLLEKNRVLTKDALQRYYQTPLKYHHERSEALESPKDIPTLREAVEDFEREYITEAILNTKTLKDAAKRLDIDLDTLNRKKKKLGIYKRYLK